MRANGDCKNLVSHCTSNYSYSLFPQVCSVFFFLLKCVCALLWVPSEAEKDMHRKQFQAETQSLRRELMSLRKAKERMQAAVEVFAEKHQKSPFRDRGRQVLDELANLRKENTGGSLYQPPPLKSSSPESPSTAESNKPTTPESSPPEAQGTPRCIEA